MIVNNHKWFYQDLQGAGQILVLEAPDKDKSKIFWRYKRVKGVKRVKGKLEHVIWQKYLCIKVDDVRKMIGTVPN